MRGLGKLPAHWTDSAFALHELKANGADRLVKLLCQVAHVIEADKLHAWNHRRKRCAVFFLVCGGQCAKRAAVEGVLQRQNAPFGLHVLRTVGPRVSTGQLERSFPGFSAAVGEKGAIRSEEHTYE